MSNGLERREFLKVLGVSGAGASLAACGTGATEKLIPYVVPHEEIVPGLSTWYRTTCRECPAGCGMNIRTREGRAIKAEGNPLSAISHGRLCARGQASLHGLYDPDRVPRPLERTGEGEWRRITWDEGERRLGEELLRHRGRTVFLTGHYGGTMDTLVDAFVAAAGARRVRYEPFAWEPLRAASRMVYGVDAVPVHDFGNAEVVITFGADFMETWLSPIDYMHGFVKGRAYSQGRRGKLISVGAHQSLTDMNADQWLPVRPGTEHLVALALARLIVDRGADAGAAAALLQGIDVASAAQRAGISPERLRQVAADFTRGGRSLAVGPGVQTQHTAATAVAAAVAVLNQVAGNVGTTVRLDQREEFATGGGTFAGMLDLVASMRRGEVGALVVHGPNPLYSMPGQADVAAGLAAVPFIASFSSMLDETSRTAHLLLPDHHFLESWGDYTPRTGIAALVQPVMIPVFETKQTGDVLISVARRINADIQSQATTYYDYLRERWARDIAPAAGAAGPFDDWWREALTIGFVHTAAPAAPQAVPPLDVQGLDNIDVQEATFTGAAGDDAYYLVVYPSARFWDGRLANRPWLQELPDPVSKFCWSSWVEINPTTADRLRIDNGHIVEVETERGTISAPAWRHPGIRPDTIAIQLGQGHEHLGRYARERGVNALTLLDPIVEPASGALVYVQTRARLRNTGQWERPIQSSLQDSQHDREVARATSIMDARRRDEARGQPLLPLAVAYSAPGYIPGPDRLFEPDIHPMDARVRSLQGAGGWAAAEIDASPAGFPQPGTYYGEYSETQPRWAMAIDLERCTGCSACVTACYAENNIGIVGPDQVMRGRILNWIRIERYFEGEGENMETMFLPMLCQQCGTAPCEPVCPVYAAYHTPDGLNAQVYNRCVGTRYCANNCPYKVRVFNWHTPRWPEPLNWQLNPDVTVRETGVMEKCTFCVQRIRDAQNNARIQDRAATDGEITPACAQTCPGDAIVFGNIRDPNSRVAHVSASGRGYRVFEKLNTQAAVTYLRKVSLRTEPDRGGDH
jgi:molybdopterin-containing oxidoreductase family iron-sulfur binding subunit